MNSKEQEQMPFFAAAKAYADSNTIPFHMPGHKRGKGAAMSWREFTGENVLRIDSTEVDDLDDLHRPVSTLKEAQALAADLHGAERSFFLVNGTTCGIQAMILTACNPGDKIIIPRNAHRSITSGIIMAGAQPVYLQPYFDSEFGLPMGVTVEGIKQALSEHPDVKAVLVINPTFYGAAADLQQIVETVHRHGIPVLVDEAHGPHLQFHSALPIAALAAGADMTAQSYHKILGSLTQSSMLHVKSRLVDIERLQAMLQLVQTTSPSQLLLTSLDAARMQIATEGQTLMARTIELAETARAQLKSVPGLKCLGSEHCKGTGFVALDLTKLTVSVRNLGITGIKAEQILREEYNIQAELSDLQNVLMMITLGDSAADITQLIAGFTGLAAKYGVKHNNVLINEETFPNLVLPRQRMLPRAAFFAKTREVRLEDAEGRICAEFVVPYPPGIPALVPGEEISCEMIAYLTAILAAGTRLQGPADVNLNTIRIIDET